MKTTKLLLIILALVLGWVLKRIDEGLIYSSNNEI